MRLGSALAAVLVVGAAASGCGLNQEGIMPPPDRIFYPGAIAIDPRPTAPNLLYVLNSNADLRFNDGTLVVVNLDDVKAARDNALSQGNKAPAQARELCGDSKYFNPLDGDSHYCCWDALDSNVLNCDERQFIKSDATVRLGSFGSALQFDTGERSQMNMPGEPARLFAAVRGNASITWLNVANQGTTSVALDCGGSSAPGAFAECDDQHRVNLTKDPNRPIEEPYAMALDDQWGLLYVGHLRGGYLSSIDLEAPGGKPALVNVNPGIFPGDVNGSTGVTSLTVTSTGINTGRIYATSRYVPRAGAFAPISYGQNADNESTFLANAGDVFISPLAGSEMRGIQPIPLTHRTYVLQRTPPALIAFNTTGGQNIPSDVIEMCTGPTFLVMDPPLRPDGDDGTDKLLFVNCFESGQVYVVDPYVARIVAIIEVGRGPAGFVLPQAQQGQQGQQGQPHPDFGYVVGFGSNNVSVVDLRPMLDGQLNRTQYHVIERIGFPDPVPR